GIRKIHAVAYINSADVAIKLQTIIITITVDVCFTQCKFFITGRWNIDIKIEFIAIKRADTTREQSAVKAVKISIYQLYIFFKVTGSNGYRKILVAQFILRHVYIRRIIVIKKSLEAL